MAGAKVESVKITEYGVRIWEASPAKGDRKGGVTESCSLTDATQSHPYPRAELAKEIGGRGSACPNGVRHHRVNATKPDPNRRG